MGHKLKFEGGQELQSELRLNVDTGIDVGAGSVGVSAAGFRVQVGRVIGFNTPVGGVRFKIG